MVSYSYMVLYSIAHVPTSQQPWHAGLVESIKSFGCGKLCEFVWWYCSLQHFGIRCCLGNHGFSGINKHPDTSLFISQVSPHGELLNNVELQYIGGFLMLKSLAKKGYSLNLCIPSAKELFHMIEIAAPVLLTMLSKVHLPSSVWLSYILPTFHIPEKTLMLQVSFYAFITFLSTSLGAVTLGAHQVHFPPS